MKLPPDQTFRPRMVIAYADSAYAALCSRHFRRHGWEVFSVRSGADMSRLVEDLSPHVVVLDTELPDEGGWLACAKHLREQPDVQVILVSRQKTAEEQYQADLLGIATLIGREEGVAPLLDVVLGAALSITA